MSQPGTNKRKSSLVKDAALCQIDGRKQEVPLSKAAKTKIESTWTDGQIKERETKGKADTSWRAQTDEGKLMDTPFSQATASKSEANKDHCPVN